MSSLAVHLSGPYCKIRTAQGTNQNALFHRSWTTLPYNKNIDCISSPRPPLEIRREEPMLLRLHKVFNFVWPYASLWTKRMN